VVARLGEVWFDKNPSYWPGPLTYFGLIVWPLILLYVIDDMRRYLMASHAVASNKNEINSIKWIEVGLMVSIAMIMFVGLYKAIKESKNLYGKNFEFISFLFGAPMILKGTKTRKTEHCTTELFEKYSKITKSPAASGAQGFSGLLIFWIGISVFIALGTFTFRGKQIKRYIRETVVSVENKKKDKKLGSEKDL